ncbi:DGAT1/2-independent enzyme synthesizing storage lipids-like [Tiliqua scincoides]|uniref:DGAT1/2-independent enzyme synthesizing storage lipids-like n=1 Tax=Tiliqua scincoides TaxID=71010 RepID=UPI0034619F11
MAYSDFPASVLEDWLLHKYSLYAVIGVLVLNLIILAFFIIPLSQLFFVYLSALLVLIYKKTHKLKGAYSSNKWDGARLILSILWDGFARFWHGYELYGTENLPDGPGLIIFYHGAVPVDHGYFIARYFILKQRIFFTVIEDFVFKLPGVKTLAAVLCFLPKKKESCLNALKDGHLVGISPGGTREALFSDESYKLIWHKRKGFAEVALDAKVSIIPVYTQNTREAYRTFGKTVIARWLYEQSRLPVIPPYGGFPVKLRTYIGEPIPYDPNITAMELAQKTKIALQSLIQKHQQIPGSICNALMERLQLDKKKE